MSRDTLFLLQPGFPDPAYPDRVFYCWHCALMEGVLASFPDLARRIEVVRIPFPKPRRQVIEAAGEAHQAVPLLLLPEGETSPHQTGIHKGRAFIDTKDGILAALTDRHGFPDPHP